VPSTQWPETPSGATSGSAARLFAGSPLPPGAPPSSSTHCSASGAAGALLAIRGGTEEGAGAWGGPQEHLLSDTEEGEAGWAAEEQLRGPEGTRIQRAEVEEAPLGRPPSASRGGTYPLQPEGPRHSTKSFTTAAAVAAARPSRASSGSSQVHGLLHGKSFT
jgi:hypothetical protein